MDTTRFASVQSVHCPCLVIQSSGQKVTDPQRIKAASSVIEHVAFIEVESEHWIPATQPEKLCQLIDNRVLNKQS